MSLHKRVNGKRVKLTPIQEVKLRAEWADWKENIIPALQVKQDIQEKIARKIRNLAIEELKQEGELANDYTE